MGDFTQIDIQIECIKETVAEAVCEVIQDFENKVKEHILKDNEQFDFNITDIDDFDGQVEIRLNSGRRQNAEWQLNAIIKILQEEKIFPSNICADMNLQCILNLDGEDLREYKPVL